VIKVGEVTLALPLPPSSSTWMEYSPSSLSRVKACAAGTEVHTDRQQIKVARTEKLIPEKTGEVTADIQWSSSNYDYMIVDGEKYLPVNEEASVFLVYEIIQNPTAYDNNKCNSNNTFRCFLRHLAFGISTSST